MPLLDGYTDHKCTFCNEDELVYHQYLNDWKCQACGEWEDGE